MLRAIGPALLALVLGSATPAAAVTIANPVAAFSGLDKITARITNFDVYIGETVQFGALQITPRGSSSGRMHSIIDVTAALPEE